MDGRRGNACFVSLLAASPFTLATQAKPPIITGNSETKLS